MAGLGTHAEEIEVLRQADDGALGTRRTRGAHVAQRLRYSWLLISPKVRQYAISTPAQSATTGMIVSRTRIGVSLKDQVATNSARLVPAHCKGPLQGRWVRDARDAAISPREPVGIDQRQAERPQIEGLQRAEGRQIVDHVSAREPQLVKQSLLAAIAPAELEDGRKSIGRGVRSALRTASGGKAW